MYFHKIILIRMNINVMITKYNIKINMVRVKKKYFLLWKQITFEIVC